MQCCTVSLLKLLVILLLYLVLGSLSSVHFEVQQQAQLLSKSIESVSFSWIIANVFQRHWYKYF